MKIAYIVTRSDLIGGAQIHVRDLASALPRHGHEAVALTGANGPYVEALRQAGVQVVTLQHLGAPINPIRDVRGLIEIHSVLKSLQPDLVSTHSSKAGILGRLAARALGIPAVFTAHGWAFTPGIPRWEAAMYKRIERLAAPLAARIITVSDFDRELAVRERVVQPGKVVTVHNGMPEVDQRLQAQPGRSPARIVMIARFEPQKDHATLFRALSGLLHESWQLHLIGDGALLSAAQTMARELGLTERVRFLGQRNDVAELLATAQVALLISNWEGFPRSILEAMRAGLPVVASDVGGIAESVQDGETGFVVRQGDVEGLRRRLSTLLADPGLRVRMGRKGREHYEQQFTLAHTVERTLAVYDDIITQRRALPQ